MTKSKREWIEPDLIVLVRNRPEEAVLETCKGDFMYAGAGGQHTMCYFDDAGCWDCCNQGIS